MPLTASDAWLAMKQRARFGGINTSVSINPRSTLCFQHDRKRVGGLDFVWVKV